MNILLIVPSERDVLTLAPALGDIRINTFFDVTSIDLTDIATFVGTDDVLIIAPEGDPATHAEARRVADRVRPDAESVRTVVAPGATIALPGGLDTPGIALVWLLGLPDLPPSARATVCPNKDDDDEPLPAPDWPEPIGNEAYVGPIGEAVLAVAPHTEADPGAILAQALVAFGAMVGRGPHLIIDGARHGINEFVIVVGETAASRKGTSWARARAIIAEADPDWSHFRIRNGLSSGEGLIQAVRDAVERDGEVVDPGESDKRLLIYESEFGSVLRALQREGNRLSALLRAAWDGDDLATLTRSPLRATAPHVSLVGHITERELRALLSTVDIANGLANRCLWICARRSRLLPFGGDDVDLSGYHHALALAADHARGLGRVDLTPGAREMYASVYPRLSASMPGALGEVTSRDCAHAMRLALVYAMADRSRAVDVPHLRAGLAMVGASRRAAARIFGASTGDPDADKLLSAIQAAPEGLTREHIRREVAKSWDSGRRAAALGMLVRAGLVVEGDVPGPGRTAKRYTVAGGMGVMGGKPPGREPHTTLSTHNTLNTIPANGHREVVRL